MGEVLCVVCQKRTPDRPLVDDACRSRLRRLLDEIPELYAELTEDVDLVEVDGVLVLDDGTFDGPVAYDVVRLGAARISGTATAGRVSGTPEAPVPVNLDLVDLTAPARAGSYLPHANAELHAVAAIVTRTRTLERHEYAAQWTDQIGHLSVATTLDAWVRDWRGHRTKREGWPAATVGDMAGWLGDRLDDACDDHPAVDEFAADISDVHAALRGVLGLIGPWPELLRGVPCRRCDTAALSRMPPKEYGVQQYIECGECGDLMTPEEYERWTQLLAASARRPGRVKM